MSEFDLVVRGGTVADGTGNAVRLALVHQQRGDADAVEDLVRGLRGRRDDRRPAVF